MTHQPAAGLRRKLEGTDQWLQRERRRSWTRGRSEESDEFGNVRRDACQKRPPCYQHSTQVGKQREVKNVWQPPVDPALDGLLGSLLLATEVLPFQLRAQRRADAYCSARGAVAWKEKHVVKPAEEKWPVPDHRASGCVNGDVYR